MNAMTAEWWRAIGEPVDEYEIPFINPFDPSYPAWPADDRWLRLIRTPVGTGVVTTDGLGDAQLPEYFVELAQPPSELSGQWATNLLLEVGRLVPSNADAIVAMLAQYGVLSVSLELDGAPAEWTTPQGVGILLGLPHGHRSGRRLVNVKLMRPAEVAYSMEHGTAGRDELRARYERQGPASISDLQRASVV